MAKRIDTWAKDGNPLITIVRVNKKVITPPKKILISKRWTILETKGTTKLVKLFKGTLPQLIKKIIKN